MQTDNYSGGEEIAYRLEGEFISSFHKQRNSQQGDERNTGSEESYLVGIYGDEASENSGKSPNEYHEVQYKLIF